MPRYRKKPVEIEAVQLTYDTLNEAANFVASDQFAGGGADSERGVYVDIRTLEGVMRASEGDWIIKGVKGEFYPCKPDIFAATYEAA